MRHSDVVYNLVGRNYPTKYVSCSRPLSGSPLTPRNYSLEDVHVEGTERIAEAVAKYDVDRFIHVSSYNANPASESAFFATKGRGELAARSIFPETTIVRPAPMFGFEDNLLLRLAGMYNMFTANNMQERYWPVHVIDVGTALEHMLYDDATAGETFELYGPKNYSTAEIAEIVDREILQKRRHINLPKAVLQPLATLLNRVLWWPVLSGEDVEREFIDQVIDETAKTFKDLGIVPGEIQDYTYHYLVRFSPSSSSSSFSPPCILLLTPRSKDTAARRSTTCRRRQSWRSGRSASTCTLWTTSRGVLGVAWSREMGVPLYGQLLLAFALQEGGVYKPIVKELNCQHIGNIAKRNVEAADVRLIDEADAGCFR